MGCFYSKIYPSEDEFKGAGCVFMSKTHILAGYQPKKRIAHISGFGGKRQEGETFLVTAMRETLEELLDIKDIPKKLISRINETILPSKVIIRGSYILCIYSFRQLFGILHFAKDYLKKIPAYPSGVPESLDTLLLSRSINPDSEISHICLLPILTRLRMDPFFLEDIGKISEDLIDV